MQNAIAIHKVPLRKATTSWQCLSLGNVPMMSCKLFSFHSDFISITFIHAWAAKSELMPAQVALRSTVAGTPFSMS